MGSAYNFYKFSFALKSENFAYGSKFETYTIYM